MTYRQAQDRYGIQGSHTVMTWLCKVANIPACLIGIEASTGAFFCQNEFEKLDIK